MGEITKLLAEARQGNGQAVEDLIQAVYPELRKLAQQYMGHERPDHTLQATALVHEAYLRLMGQEGADWRDHVHFFAAAARVMRQLLVDHARARLRIKRDGGQRISLDEALTLDLGENDELVALDEALEKLSQFDSRLSQIVELRYFGGLKNEEIASILYISERTVIREWQVAKAWLYKENRRGE